MQRRRRKQKTMDESMMSPLDSVSIPPDSRVRGGSKVSTSPVIIIKVHFHEFRAVLRLLTPSIYP
jgi:hypothetical protein